MNRVHSLVGTPGKVVVCWSLVLLLCLHDSQVDGFPLAASRRVGTQSRYTMTTKQPLAAHLAAVSSNIPSKMKFTQTQLASSTGEENNSSVDGDGGNEGISFKTLGKYVVALVVQMGLITGVLKGLDELVSRTTTVPFAVNVVLFYALALKSRVFNPLSNRRPLPKTKEIEGQAERKMPTWTPPGFVFPIVWLLLIGPLRAVTSSMVYRTTGSYADKAILSLMLHLSIGDVWNTINNVERRYGTSVVFVSFVWSSAAFAAYQYSQVLPLAGKLLSLKLIWLSVAASLIVRTWQLNPNPKTGKKYPLLPRVGDDADTKIIWFSKKSSDD
eukprot:scaffold22736_cov111-Cylindrotheca_fusiformis.AAC.4